jgi:uncharacterized protein (TIGR03437 family)
MKRRRVGAQPRYTDQPRDRHFERAARHYRRHGLAAGPFLRLECGILAQSAKPLRTAHGSGSTSEPQPLDGLDSARCASLMARAQAGASADAQRKSSTPSVGGPGSRALSQRLNVWIWQGSDFARPGSSEIDRRMRVLLPASDIIDTNTIVNGVYMRVRSVLSARRGGNGVMKAGLVCFLLLAHPGGLFGQPANFTLVPGLSPTGLRQGAGGGLIYMETDGKLKFTGITLQTSVTTVLQSPYTSVANQPVGFTPSPPGSVQNPFPVSNGLLSCDGLDAFYTMYEKSNSGFIDTVRLKYHPLVPLSTWPVAQDQGLVMLSTGDLIGSDANNTYYLLGIWALQNNGSQIIIGAYYTTTPIDVTKVSVANAQVGVFVTNISATSQVPTFQRLAYSQGYTPSLSQTLSLQLPTLDWAWMTSSENHTLYQLYQDPVTGQSVTRPFATNVGANVLVSSLTEGSVLAYQQSCVQYLTQLLPGQTIDTPLIASGQINGQRLGLVSLLKYSADGGVWVRMQFDNGLGALAYIKGGMPYILEWESANLQILDIQSSTNSNILVVQQEAGQTKVYNVSQSTVSVPPPPPVISSITEGAQFQPGCSPGSICTVFGTGLAGQETHAATEPLPTSLSGVTVSVNGKAVPLLYVVGAQVNFLLPLGTAAGQSSLVVCNSDGCTSPYNFPVYQALPGIFACGAAKCIYDQAGRLVTAASSSPVFTMYTTGLGAVTNPPKDGDAALANPLSQAVGTVNINIGNSPAKVFFAGLAPGFTGLYQIDFAPQVAQSGGGGPVTITGMLAIDGKSISF